MRKFRLHGDNIVECERISNLIIDGLQNCQIKRGFESLACPYIEVNARYLATDYCFRLEFFPGFNKSRNDRWNSNILEILKQEGCFLDETPDVIVTEVVDSREKIILAIEFCSALQAGNQAWQRSGRAYSVGRTDCPYIYLLDFVKYELDTNTRKRKALRFPNPAVVYSYISHSLHRNSFIVQAYIKAEEFQPTFDTALKYCPESIFGEQDISNFILHKMFELSTFDLEKTILNKNAQMVQFLSKNKNGSFTKNDWRSIYSTSLDVQTFSLEKGLRFKKKIAEKSSYGHALEFRNICTKYAVGIASPDLPFGLIPASNKAAFAEALEKLYKIDDSLNDILKSNEDMVVCILKGFKPGGDDNRPDRGALPFVAMLLDENISILTFIFGPLVKNTAKKLITNKINELSNDNGLWKAILGLSNIIIVDSPFVNDSSNGLELVINNDINKKRILAKKEESTSKLISTTPNRYQENDVDSIIHYIFKHIADNCFEGMCNPPGGDWSGLSLSDKVKEYRWLSLPRVSVDGKRPDHVIQLFGLSSTPIIVSIESKEKSYNLEMDIGVSLKKYVSNLLSFVPSVERECGSTSWKIAEDKFDINNYRSISVGAYLGPTNQTIENLFLQTKCDMLFSFMPSEDNLLWVLKIDCNEECLDVKDYLSDLLRKDKLLPIVVE